MARVVIYDQKGERIGTLLVNGKVTNAYTEKLATREERQMIEQMTANYDAQLKTIKQIAEKAGYELAISRR
jgi:hypothetical protein